MIDFVLVEKEKLPTGIRNATTLNEFKKMTKTFLFNEEL